MVRTVDAIMVVVTVATAAPCLCTSWAVLLVGGRAHTTIIRHIIIRPITTTTLRTTTIHTTTTTITIHTPFPCQPTCPTRSMSLS